MITDQSAISQILKASPQGAYARASVMLAGVAVGVSVGRGHAYWVLWQNGEGYAMAITANPDADFFSYAAKHSGGEFDVLEANIKYLIDPSDTRPRPICKAPTEKELAALAYDRLFMEMLDSNTIEEFREKAGDYILASTFILNDENHAN